MNYRCPVCGKDIKTEPAVYIKHTEQHIVDIIKKKYPEWAEKDGLCRKCLEHYRRELKGEG